MRQIGLVMGILMLLSLAGPLILAMLLATERINLLVGLVGAAPIGVIIFLATQNFLTMWKTSYWMSGRKIPTLMGNTVSGSLVYSTLMVLIGYLIQVLSGG
jgi:peptidoglycan/LPS O-acetylase OafA/YrhL